MILIIKNVIYKRPMFKNIFNYLRPFDFIKVYEIQVEKLNSKLLQLLYNNIIYYITLYV